MNWESLKKGADAALDGVTVELTNVDGCLREVRITDAKGRALLISGDYSIRASVPAKPKTVTRHVVVGEVAGLKVEEPFEEEWKASARANELNALTELDRAVKVEKREVPE